MAALVILQAIEGGADVRVGGSDQFLYVNDVQVNLFNGGIRLDGVSYPVDDQRALAALRLIAQREHARRTLNKLFNV